MTMRYVVNDYFNDKDHWVFFPHYFGARLFAWRIRSKLYKIDRRGES